MVKNMQYLTFTLNDSIYAVQVLQVREVLGYQEPQELPCPDPVIAGLIRSRGQSISVVNLRRKFSFPDADTTKETRIIVVEIDSISEYSNSQGQLVFGLIVDSVNEVIDMDSSLEEPPPEVGSSIAADFISGIGQLDNHHFVIILNIDKVLTFEEINPALLAEEVAEATEEQETEDFSLEDTEADESEVAEEQEQTEEAESSEDEILPMEDADE